MAFGLPIRRDLGLTGLCYGAAFGGRGKLLFGIAGGRAFYLGLTRDYIGSYCAFISNPLLLGFKDTFFSWPACMGLAFFPWTFALVYLFYS